MRPIAVSNTGTSFPVTRREPLAGGQMHLVIDPTILPSGPMTTRLL